MAEECDGRADTDDAWSARLGWALGLIADDPAERAVALDRLADARRRVQEAQGRFNELWWPPAPCGEQVEDRDPAIDEAARGLDQARRKVLPDALWGCITCAASQPALPFALLFLEWEARYPQEWTRHAKAWGAKQALIRCLAVPHHEEAVRRKLTDLVEIVVHRPYRCKDREYVRVARAVDSADLRRRLDHALRSNSSSARRHAGYVSWLLDRPELPNTRHVWRTWMANTETVNVSADILSQEIRHPASRRV